MMIQSPILGGLPASDATGVKPVASIASASLNLLSFITQLGRFLLEMED
jgi:hypothetical protein